MTKTLTITEAAKSLNVSDKTIRRWIEAGKLTAEKMDRKWYVHVDLRDSLIQSLDRIFYIKDHAAGLFETAISMFILGELMERGGVDISNANTSRMTGSKGGRASGITRSTKNQKARDYAARHIEDYLNNPKPLPGGLKRTIAGALKTLKWNTTKYGKRPTPDAIRKWYAQSKVDKQLRQEEMAAGDDFDKLMAITERRLKEKFSKNKH